MGYIYLMMISEMDVILLNGTLKILCPVWGGYLSIPILGEKTLHKSYKGYTTLSLDVWKMFQLLREHPQYCIISRCMLMLSKLKKSLIEPKKAFKELECILLISREVWAFLKIYQTDKPMAACMSYVSSLISNLM